MPALTDILPRLAAATPEQLDDIGTVLNGGTVDLRILRDCEVEERTGLNRWEVRELKLSGEVKLVRIPSGRTRTTLASIIAWQNRGGCPAVKK